MEASRVRKHVREGLKLQKYGNFVFFCKKIPQITRCRFSAFYDRLLEIRTPAILHPHSTGDPTQSRHLADPIDKKRNQTVLYNTSLAC